MTRRTQTIWTFAITSIALFMVSLDNLVVTTALPVIRDDLGASLEDLEWTVNAYTLTFAVLLLTGAALGDRFGRRRMFSIGLGVFTLGSIAAAARAVGRGAQHRARDAGPRRSDRDAADADAPERSRPAGEARTRARSVGRHRRARDRLRPGRRRCGRRRDRLAVDLLAQRPHRRPPRPDRDAAARGEPRRRRPARPPGRRARERRAVRDRLGSRARKRPGWASAEIVGSLGIGALLVAAFVAWELRSSAPMLPMRFFRSAAFSLANVASLLMFFGMFGSIFLLAQFFQSVQGYSPLGVGSENPPVDAGTDVHRAGSGSAV